MLPNEGNDTSLFSTVTPVTRSIFNKSSKIETHRGLLFKF